VHVRQGLSLQRYRRGSCQHSHAGIVCMALHVPGAPASLHHQRGTCTEGEASHTWLLMVLYQSFYSCCCESLRPATVCAGFTWDV
jgi:hypothetical protein